MTAKARTARLVGAEWGRGVPRVVPALRVADHIKETELGEGLRRQKDGTGKAFRPDTQSLKPEA